MQGGNVKAKADIILSMCPSELSGCEDTKDVWLKIESTYQSKRPLRKATIKNIILSRLKKCDNVRTHFVDFFEVVGRLRG